MNGGLHRLAAAAALPALPALAQEGPGVDPFDSSYLAQVLGSLVLVLLCLGLVIFLLRRINRVGPASRGRLRVLDSASVGVREKVVLLAAGEQQLLVGVAPGSVRALHVFDEAPVDVAELDRRAERADFAGVLRSVSPFGGARR